MQKRRLLKLAAFLRTLPAKKLEMGYWGVVRLHHECSTSACAIGHAVNQKLFRGLRGVSCTSLAPRYRPPGAKHCYTGFEAVEKLFDISSYAAQDLFGGANPFKTPRRVARNIENFVKRA